MVDADPRVTVGVFVLTIVAKVAPENPFVLLVCSMPFTVAAPDVPNVNVLVLALNMEAAFTVNVAALPNVTFASAVTVPRPVPWTLNCTMQRA